MAGRCSGWEGGVLYSSQPPAKMDRSVIPASHQGLTLTMSCTPVEAAWSLQECGAWWRSRVPGHAEGIPVCTPVSLVLEGSWLLWPTPSSGSPLCFALYPQLSSFFQKKKNFLIRERGLKSWLSEAEEVALFAGSESGVPASHLSPHN